MSFDLLKSLYALCLCVASVDAANAADHMMDRHSDMVPRPADAQLSERIVAYLDRLGTNDKKIDVLKNSLIGMAQPQDALVTSSLGVGPFRTQDGPAGLSEFGSYGMVGLAFPAPVTVGASFSEATAATYGAVLGREFHRAGMQGIWGPTADLTRTWHFGRASENFGEDPFLTSSLVPYEIREIQRNHVSAVVKHFVAYTQEEGRTGEAPLRDEPSVNENIDERTLREIYLEPFRAAIVAGGASGVMCAFPRINNVPACEHQYALSVLKDEWHFRGMVVPDYPDAQRSIKTAILNGMDWGVLEASKAPIAPALFEIDDAFDGVGLSELVRSHAVTSARLDDMIGRVLYTYLSTGSDATPIHPGKGDVSTPEDADELEKISADGSVLLKNSGILPLRNGVARIAVIGFQAGKDAIVNEPGSPYVEARHLSVVADALKAEFRGRARVDWAPGIPSLDEYPVVPSDQLMTESGQPGLKASYYNCKNIDACDVGPFLVRNESSLNVMGVPEIAGLAPDRAWVVRWRGKFVPRQSGKQRFFLEGNGTARVYVDGKRLLDIEKADFGAVRYGAVSATAGQSLPIEIDWTPREAPGRQGARAAGGLLGAAVHVGYVPPDDKIQRAVALAKSADVAVVVVGSRAGEGADRNALDLPGEQDELIAAVAAANPKTVVVLNTGGAVLMPWRDKVAAIVENWLPGDVQGKVISGILSGRLTPNGRLPVTFPASVSQGVGAVDDMYPGKKLADGAIGDESFREGLYVGYRYFEKFHQNPLYEFGYGLSYTNFQDKILGFEKKSNEIGLNVSVRNLGHYPGSEVLQVYVSYPAALGEPERQLKAFQKTYLKAGESRKSSIHVGACSLRTWDEKLHAWTFTPGMYRVEVGVSARSMLESRDIYVDFPKGMTNECG